MQKKTIKRRKQVNLKNTDEKILQSNLRVVNDENEESFDCNYVVIKGKISSEKRYDHSIFGERIYRSSLNIMRLSKYEDNIPISISEKLLHKRDLKVGDNLSIKGQIRSYNCYEHGKNKVDITIFAKEIEWEEIQEDRDDLLEDSISNEVILEGHICKKPSYRETPEGRKISDILLAVNRAYNKSDYIPAIAWGKNASICKKFDVGDQIKIVGRIQSRDYEKKVSDGTTEIRTAYELSVSKIKLVK